MKAARTPRLGLLGAMRILWSAIAASRSTPNGLEETWPQFAAITCKVRYDGSEGELYDLKNDPRQWLNLWNDSKHRSLESDLIADLTDNLPPERSPKLKVEAPA
jgi:hypothetical protein